MIDADSTFLTAEQADQVVRDEASGKGWVDPSMRELRDPNSLFFLRTIERLRKELGINVHL
jgi:hypothetical protein